MAGVGTALSQLAAKSRQQAAGFLSAPVDGYGGQLPEEDLGGSHLPPGYHPPKRQPAFCPALSCLWFHSEKDSTETEIFFLGAQDFSTL